MGDCTLRSLTLEKFNKDKNFYQISFDEISYSLGLYNIKDYDDPIRGPIKWGIFFKKHPINSIVFLTEGHQIVSFMYATPCRDYKHRYHETDLQHWVINFIQTHIEFQRKGYAKQVTLFGLKDMAKKGVKKVDFITNQISKPIIEGVIDKFKVGSIIDNIAFETLSFSETFLATYA